MQLTHVRALMATPKCPTCGQASCTRLLNLEMTSARLTLNLCISAGLSELVVEDAALDWFGATGDASLSAMMVII